MAGIELKGTGGIIEGNLGAASVNVNLDSALLFDGVNDSIDCNDVSTLDGATDITLTCWIKPVALSGTDYFLSKEVDGSNKIGIAWDSDLLYFQVADDSNAYGTCAFDDATYNGVWTHLALVFDGGGSGNAGRLKAYINGVEQTLSFTGTIPAQTDSNSTDFLMAKFSSNYYNGYIADVKIYNTNLGETDIQTLASKINYPDILSTGTRHWWKINEGTGAIIEDHGAATHFDGTVTGATWKYDQFYVDLQDNNTGGSGNFKVTQGKVEGLALSAAHFTGATNNYVGSSLTSDQKSTREQTFSCWFNADDVTNRGIAGRWTGSSQGMETGLFLNSSSKLVMDMNSTDADGSGTHSNQTVTGSTTIVADKWYHVVCVASSVGDDNFLKIYVNGVLDGTNASYGKYIQSSNDQFRWGWGYSGGTSEFDGHIRDVRIYAGRALTADQVSSLYSNTLPTTPDFWMKVDAGSGTDAAAFGQSGLYTATSVSPNNVDSTWLNGTLDLDNVTALTTQTNGIFSAPRGTCQVAGDITGGGKIIHNNGTFESDRASSTVNFNFSGTGVDADGNAQPMFYDVLCTSATTKIVRDTSIARELHIDSAATFKFNCNSRAVTLTMGTSSFAGEIHQDGGGFQFENNTSNAAKIVAADTSGLNPWTNVSGYNIDWDSGGSGSDVEIANGNYNGTTSTGGGGVTVTLTGDMEFDAVTVDSGDTLDLNGQRAEFGGAFDLTTGALAMNDAMAVFKHTIDFNGRVPTSNTGTTIIHNPPSTSEKLITSLYFGGTFFAQGAESDVNGYAWQGSSGSGEYPEKIFVGGQLDCQQSVKTITNLQVATGGELRGNDRTITCEGDLIMSGGLIGKSALNLTGSEEVTGTDNLDEVATSNRVTVEAWFKATTDANYRAIFSRGTSWSTGNIYMYMNSTGNVQFSMNDLGATVTSTTAGLADGKWHHAAATYDQTNLKLYIDGKLEASSAYTNPINTQTNGFKIGDRDGDNWVGQIGRVSIWDAALTPSQIREMLFYDFATADSEATIPDANCIGWWQFDKGSSTEVADSSTNNADGTLNSAAWAEAGTFTHGTSTVDLTGTGALTYEGTINFYILKCAATAGNKTTTISRLSGGDIHIARNLYVGDGTLARGSSLGWRLSRDSGIGNIDNNGTVVSGASYPVDLSDTYVVYYHDATIAKEVKWEYFINGTNTTLAANQEATGYWMNAAYQTDVGDYNLKCGYMRFSDSANGKFIMGAGDLWMTNAGNGLELTYPSNTFSAGPGATISGSSAGTNFKSQNDFVIVGNVENLAVTNEELKVTGLVTNCTGDIHQYFPTIDHDQQIDADTADDRDIQLHGDKLDRDTELINS